MPCWPASPSSPWCWLEPRRCQLCALVFDRKWRTADIYCRQHSALQHTLLLIETAEKSLCRRTNVLNYVFLTPDFRVAARSRTDYERIRYHVDSVIAVQAYRCTRHAMHVWSACRPCPGFLRPARLTRPGLQAKLEARVFFSSFSSLSLAGARKLT